MTEVRRAWPGKDLAANTKPPCAGEGSKRRIRRIAFFPQAAGCDSTALLLQPTLTWFQFVLQNLL